MEFEVIQRFSEGVCVGGGGGAGGGANPRPENG